jgi:hypothetical protein
MNGKPTGIEPNPATQDDVVWTDLDLNHEPDRLYAYNARWQDTAFGRRWHAEQVAR